MREISLLPFTIAGVALVAVVRMFRRAGGCGAQRSEAATGHLRRLPLVSVIVPAHNAAPWIGEALESILGQEGIENDRIEVSVYNDLSSDATHDILLKSKQRFESLGFHFTIGGRNRISASERPGGDGKARNLAVRQSKGKYLCFLDADDAMMSNRISRQLELARRNPDAIVGSRFFRLPENSTEHYTRTLNELTDREVVLRQYREITIIQPTWFFHRNVYDKVGGYPEMQGLNDLAFFHKHLDHGGGLVRDPKALVMYRYTSTSLSWKSSRQQILKGCIKPFERRVLSKWKKFSIWGSGRDGKNFFKQLSKDNKKKVIGFCDIDPKKIKRGFQDRNGYSLPIVHWTQVKPPVVICVSMGRTGGHLERNIASLGLVEGVNYWHFS